MQAGQAILTLADSQVSFRVTPEILLSKSTEAAGKVNSMKRHFEELRALMDKTKGYWLGEGGDKHRQLYYDLEKDTEEILRRLGEHPADLVTIAQRYFNVEMEIQQAVQELPGDVIV